MAFKSRVQVRRVPVDQCGELKDKTVAIGRVAKVVKGGRRFSFSALVITGDGRGHVGFGLGKAAEVPDALRKAGEAAKKSLIRVPIRGSTIPHDVIGEYGPTKVIMRPAPPGTGVIAGAAVRGALEAAGIRDVCTKVLGSSNSFNVVRATVAGLLRLRDPENCAAMRGNSVEGLQYSAY